MYISTKSSLLYENNLFFCMPTSQMYQWMNEKLIEPIYFKVAY